MPGRRGGVVVATAMALGLAVGVPAAEPQAGPPGLTSICWEEATNEYWMRANNPTDGSLTFTWRDNRSSQTGSGTAPPRTHTFFAVADGGSPHTIIINFENGVQAPKATNRNACQGSATVTKSTGGSGTPPDGASWPFEISGGTGLVRDFSLSDGGSRTEQNLPGGLEAGSVPIGTTPPGGVAYAVRETDPLGAVVATTLDQFVITAAANVTANFTNSFISAFSGSPTDPPVPLEPAPPGAGPPGAPGPARLTLGPSADVGVFLSVSPPRGRVGERFTARVRVENRGPSTATSVEVTDIPTLPVPNRTARVELARSSQGSCTSIRPIRCRLGDLPVGGVATIEVRARVQVEGQLSETVRATSPVFDPNRTNNQDVGGVVVQPGAAGVRLTKSAGATSVAAGGVVGYALRLEGRGPSDAVNLRLCDRVPGGMSIAATSRGAFLADGRVCWTVNRLASGQVRRYSLQMRTNTDAAGGEVANVAAVSGDNVRDGRATARVRVLQRGPTRPPGVTG